MCREDHLSRLIVALVREELDLSAIAGSYTSGLGQPPFDPRMMTALLLHGYASGIYSSRRIAKAAVERADFMMIVAGDPPDFRTISEFRKRHLKALAALFVQVLKLCREGRAGEARARGARRHQDQGECVQAQSDELRAHEEAGSGACRPRSTAGWRPPRRPMRRRTSCTAARRGDEMPDWVADKQKRLAKIRAAKAELEAEAKAAAEEETRRRAEAEEKRIAEGRKKNGKTPAPPSEEPDGKAQRNFTDPESRILKTKDGYIQGYNAQAAVDGDGADHRRAWPDAEHERPGPARAALDAIEANLGRQAEGGLRRCRLLLRGEPCRRSAERGIAGYIATGRAKHPADAKRKISGPLTQAMRRQAQAGGMAQPLPIAEADRRAGVRTDQAGTEASGSSCCAASRK